MQVLHGMHTNDPSYVLRIDKATGKTIWRVERPTKAIRESPDAYTTPALLAYNSSTEIVITGADVATGHDPATGKELWRVDGLNPSNDCVVPHRRLADRRRRHDLCAVARAADSRHSAPAGGATSRGRTSSGRSTAVPTCRRRSPTDNISTSFATTG